MFEIVRDDQNTVILFGMFLISTGEFSELWKKQQYDRCMRLLNSMGCSGYQLVNFQNFGNHQPYVSKDFITSKDGGFLTASPVARRKICCCSSSGFPPTKSFPKKPFRCVKNGFPFFLVSYQEKNFPGTIEWAGKQKHHDFRLKRFRLLCPTGSFGSEKIPCNFCQRKFSHLQRGTSKKFQSKHHF